MFEKWHIFFENPYNRKKANRVVSIFLLISLLLSTLMGVISSLTR